MPDESIIIPIEINESGVITGFKNIAAAANVVEKDVQDIGKAFDRSAGQMNRGFSKISGAGGFDSFSSSVHKAESSLTRLSPVSGQATFALTNMGRVVQDLPYGFIGIANNLNPALESMQRLIASTGSVGGAMKVLGASLLGPGGIGIALSLVTTGILLFSNGFQNFSRKAKTAKEDVDRLAEVLKELGNIPERKETISAGTSGELSKVIALSNAVLDQTKSYKERNKALDQLKDINKNYFGDLTLEAASLAKLTDKVDEYTNAIIAAATVKAFADDIGKLSVEFAKQIQVFNKVGNSLDEYKRKLAVTNEFYTSLTGEERAGSKEYVELTKKISSTTKEYNKQVGVIGDLKGKLLEWRSALKDAVNESLKFEPLSTDKSKKGLSELQKEFNAFLLTFAKIADKVFNIPVRLQFSDFDTAKQELDKAKKVFEGVQNFEIKMKLPDISKIEAGSIPVQLEPQPPDPKAFEKWMEQMKKAFQEPFVFDFTIDIAVFNQNIKEKLDKALRSGNFSAALDLIDTDKSNTALDGLTDDVKNTALLINNTLTPAMNGFFDAILDGENPMKAFFNSIIQSINQVINRLIAAAIQAAILSSLSGGATSFGSAFGKLFGGGGGIANRVAFAGGGASANPVELIGVLRGSDIYLSGQAGAAQLGRAG